ncbi:MAG: hypothetical protein ACLQLH_14780 [Terracidiphilus sp.]
MRITIQENGDETLLTLEGRVAGPWAAELRRIWDKKAAQLAQGKLRIDICNVMYADDEGTRVLKEICFHTRCQVIARTPWTQHLAREISGENQTQ